MDNQTLLKQLEKVQGRPVFVQVSKDELEQLNQLGAFDSGEYHGLMMLDQNRKRVYLAPLEVL